MEIPAKFESVQKTALAALQPIEPAPLDSYFYGERTQAGAKLPAYHLVYFLFVELLRFPSLGESEKVAWSVPIMVDGKNYVVEHRKMGLGLFAHYGKIDEQEAA